MSVNQILPVLSPKNSKMKLDETCAFLELACRNVCSSRNEGDLEKPFATRSKASANFLSNMKSESYALPAVPHFDLFPVFEEWLKNFFAPSAQVFFCI